VIITSGEPNQPAQLVFDGELVPAAAAQAPRKVNPGRHVVVARSGTLEKREEFTISEREARTVTVDLRPVAAAVEPVAPTPNGSGSPLPKILMFGGFGVGVAGVGIGAVTGLLSIAKVSDVKKDCIGDVCKPSRQGDIDAARSLGTVSTVAFVVGGVGIGAGVVGIVLSGRAPKEPPGGTSARAARLTFVPEVGPTWIGAHGSF